MEKERGIIYRNLFFYDTFFSIMTSYPNFFFQFLLGEYLVFPHLVQTSLSGEIK